MPTATIKYIGDRPFFQTTVDVVGRILFNHHNNFTKELPAEACDSIMKQFGKFFEVKEVERVDEVETTVTVAVDANPVEVPPHKPFLTKAERAVISERLKKAHKKRECVAARKKRAAARLEKTGMARSLTSRQKMAKKMKAARAETTWISRGPKKGLKYDRASVLAARYSAHFQSASN